MFPATNAGSNTILNCQNPISKASIDQQRCTRMPACMKFEIPFMNSQESRRYENGVMDIGADEILTEGKAYTFQWFTLRKCVSIGDTDLTNYLHKHISVDGLFVFDECFLGSEED